MPGHRTPLTLSDDKENATNGQVLPTPPPIVKSTPSPSPRLSPRLVELKNATDIPIGVNVPTGRGRSESLLSRYDLKEKDKLTPPRSPMLPRSTNFAYEEPIAFQPQQLTEEHLKLLYLLSLYSHSASGREEKEKYIRQLPLLVLIYEGLLDKDHFHFQETRHSTTNAYTTNI